jgi:hypothetical protein
MPDNTSQGPQGTGRDEGTGAALRLVGGHASPEEIAALVAVLATATASDDGDPAPTGRPSSQWSTHRRVFHTTYPHGPGGWRASAFPH